MTEGTEAQKNSWEHLFQGDEWELPPDMTIADPAGNEVRKRFGRAGWPDEELMFVDVAVGETIMNAIVHGALDIAEVPEGMSTAEAVQQRLAQGSPKGTIKVSLSISSEEARVRIADEGNGFDVSKVPDPTAPENLMKNKGRGKLFMQAGFDSVEYNEKGNEVTLIKKRKPANVPPAADGA